MPIVNDEVDVVIVGLGWTGSIMSIELAKAGLKVRALESGPERTNAEYIYPKPADQLGYSVRQKVFGPASKGGLTVRHDRSQTALPTRRWGAFKPGDGVGGAGGIVCRATSPARQTAGIPPLKRERSRRLRKDPAMLAPVDHHAD